MIRPVWSESSSPRHVLALRTNQRMIHTMSCKGKLSQRSCRGYSRRRRFSCNSQRVRRHARNRRLESKGYHARRRFHYRCRTALPVSTEDQKLQNHSDGVGANSAPVNMWVGSDPWSCHRRDCGRGKARQSARRRSGRGAGTEIITQGKEVHFLRKLFFVSGWINAASHLWSYRAQYSDQGS